MLARLSQLAIVDPGSESPRDGQPALTVRPLRALATRERDDPTIAFLDAWATVGDVLSFYQERIANEGFIRTATERRSILQLGRLIGYTLRPGVAATAYISYELDSGARLTLPAGSSVRSVPGPDEEPQVFETAEEVELRAEWSDLAVRRTRPVRADELVGDNRGEVVAHLEGISSGLRANDPLLVDLGDRQELLRVLDVQELADEQRTRVTCRTWVWENHPTPVVPEVDVERPTRPDAARLQALVGHHRDLEAARLPSRGVIAGRVLTVLERLHTDLMLGMSGDELLAFVRSDVLPPVRDELVRARRTRSAALQAWVDGLVHDLESWAGGEQRGAGAPGAGDRASSLPADGNPERFTGGTTAASGRGDDEHAEVESSTIGTYLSALAKRPSAQPPDASALRRRPEDAFGPSSDLLPKLLTGMRPDIRDTLYTAWRNLPATPATRLRVYALRTHASPFGHAAPPELVKDRGGTVIGTREWPLEKVSGDRVTEQFEVELLLPLAAQDDEPAEITITISEEIASARPSMDELLEGSFPVDIPGADEQVLFSVSPPGVSPVTPGELAVVFVRRGIRFEATVEASPEEDATEDGGRQVGPLWSWSSDGSDPTGARFSVDLVFSDPEGRRPPRSTWVRIGIDGSTSVPDGRVPTEQADVVSLDSVYPGVAPEGWIVLDRPAPHDGRADQRLVISRVVDVREGSRNDYGITGKSTHVRLERPWLDLGPDGDTFAVLRGTAAYIESQPLTLAETPLDPVADALCGEEIPLDELHDGLEPGRWLIVSGERTDVSGDEADLDVGDPAAGVPGVPAAELVMLAGVRQEFDPLDPGASARSTLVLAAPLSYCYRRDSVVVHGNVVKATHGETREEVLGSGDAGRPNLAFALRQRPLTYVSATGASGVANTLTVRVDGVRWHETDTLVGAGSNDRLWVTRTDDDDVVHVIFGNGREGARPPTGEENITATYRTGLGRPGNVRAGTLTLPGSRPQGVKAVDNPLPAAGGADREGRDEARRNIPLSVTSSERIVSIEDYAHLARTFGGIGKADAVRLSSGRREVVHVTIAGVDDGPLEGSDVPSNLRRAFVELGDPFQPVEIAVRRLRSLVVAASVLVEPDHRWADVEPVVRASLSERFAFVRRDFGQDVARSDVLSVIQHVPGVISVDLTILDALGEEDLVDELTEPTEGGLGSRLQLRSRVRAERAHVVQTLGIVPAELVVLDPRGETVLLSERSP